LQLASALDHLHFSQKVPLIAHRQLDNPAHILIDADDDVRLLVTTHSNDG
jgi:hypothetical protein